MTALDGFPSLPRHSSSFWWRVSWLCRAARSRCLRSVWGRGWGGRLLPSKHQPAKGIFMEAFVGSLWSVEQEFFWQEAEPQRKELK